MLDYEVSPGDGQELALIHAGICDSGMWDAQWQTLGQRYRTVRHDMRGFGKSPLPDDDFSNTLDAASETGSVRQMPATTTIETAIARYPMIVERSVASLIASERTTRSSVTALTTRTPRRRRTRPHRASAP